MTSQVTREIVPRMLQHTRTMAYRLRDFTRMNPPMFFLSKMDEDTQDFVDDVYKNICAMDVTTRAKVDLSTYKLKDLAQIWYSQ